MKKYIVFGVNSNIDYLYYLPIALWSWKRIGWEPIVIFDQYRGDALSTLVSNTVESIGIKANAAFISDDFKLSPYRSDTLSQVSRLYASALPGFAIEDMLMLGDVDLIALSDAWHPEEKDISIYNHDLTDFTEYPMCYVSMTIGKWRTVMNIEEGDFNMFIKRDLDNCPNAQSLDFYKRWGVDQQILTDRVSKENRFEKRFYYNGKRPNGYAMGRIDRGSWNIDVDNPKDCHMHRDIFKAFQNPNHESYDTFSKKWSDTMRMLEKCFPGENFDWFLLYTKEYAKLAQA